MKPYYERAGIRLYHGNSWAVLPTIDLLDVQVVVADPPYSNPSVLAGSRQDCARSVRWKWLHPRSGAPAGRKAIGIEVQERYCEIAAKQLAQELSP